ncbi:MAG: hypothetical protein EBU90_17365 [Proteobacteria bacterium]|nr:hypothetical protein [Pseudomonadota bacterium]
MRSLFFLLFCSGCGATWGSQATTIEPLPIKFGGFKDSSIELAIPIKVEKKKSGVGYRSPIEIRVRALLTRPDNVPVPIIPSGCEGRVRIRW